MAFRKLIVPGWIARKERRQAEEQQTAVQRVARPSAKARRRREAQAVTAPLLRRDPMRGPMRGITPMRDRLMLAGIANGRVRRGEARRYRHPQARRLAREAR